jgi:TRAP-type uncharacterized transport system fused permease subunit
LTVRLALADAAALVLFAIVGMLSHDGVSASGLARDALPLLAAWFAVALVVGTYRGPSWRTLLQTWALAVPLGVLLRALVLGRDLDGGQAAFLATTLVFTLLFLAAVRYGVRRAREG